MVYREMGRELLSLEEQTTKVVDLHRSLVVGPTEETISSFYDGLGRFFEIANYSCIYICGIFYGKRSEGNLFFLNGSGHDLILNCIEGFYEGVQSKFYGAQARYNLHFDKTKLYFTPNCNEKLITKIKGFKWNPFKKFDYRSWWGRSRVDVVERTKKESLFELNFEETILKITESSSDRETFLGNF